MHHTLDKIALYVLSYVIFFPFFSLLKQNTLFFTLLLFCISGLLFYFDTKRILWICAIAFIAICFSFPNAFFFMPFILYDTFYKKEYRYALFYAIPLLKFYSLFSIHEFVIFCFLIFLSFLFAQKSAQLISNQNEIMRLKDNSRELKFLSAKQKKQDDEKHTSELHITKLQERNRIAREIHDNVGHLISRSILLIGAMKVINHQENLSESIDTLKETLDDAMNSIRDSVHDLKDDSFDLESMIQNALEYYSRYEIHFDYVIESKLPIDLKYAIFSIIKEALSNTAKHSNATKINLLFHEQSLGYRLLIEDNGFLVSSDCVKNDILFHSSKHGIGLENMKERILAFNGSLRIQCEHGFTISIFIPKNNS